VCSKFFLTQTSASSPPPVKGSVFAIFVGGSDSVAEDGSERFLLASAGGGLVIVGKRSF
jgi:hypothetical protein